MRYPKGCYRIGNWFKDDEGKSYPWTRKIKDDDELRSISAETLASLAVKNEDCIRVLFGAYGSGSVKIINKVNAIHGRKTNEAWGTFFLRVAKERKYIK